MFRSRVKLKDVMIAAPCPASWDNMEGDDKTRNCALCALTVYNLSEMTKGEAEKLLSNADGQRMCLQFFRRADGTILTKDCPIGKRILNGVTRRAKVAVGALISLLNVFPAFAGDVTPTGSDPKMQFEFDTQRGNNLSQRQNSPGHGAWSGVGVGGGVGHASPLVRKKAPVLSAVPPLQQDDRTENSDVNGSARQAPQDQTVDRSSSTEQNQDAKDKLLKGGVECSSAELTGSQNEGVTQVSEPLVVELGRPMASHERHSGNALEIQNANQLVSGSGKSELKPPPAPSLGAFFGGGLGLVPPTRVSWVKKIQAQPKPPVNVANILSEAGVSLPSSQADARPLTYFQYALDYERQKNSLRSMECYAYAVSIIREERAKFDPKFVQVVASGYAKSLRRINRPKTAKAIECEFAAPRPAK